MDLSVQLQNKKSEISLIKRTNKKVTQKLMHNLINSIGSVTSFSGMILEDIELYDTCKLKKHVGIIKKSADYSILFLKKTAQFLRLQSAEVSFIYKKLNYIDLLNQVVNELEVLSSEKRIDIKREFKQEEYPLLLIEEEIINVLSYILNNAIRFSGEKATITILVQNSDTHIETIITDEGIGISEDDLRKVFDEYYVVATYSEDGEKCIGLGLTMAKMITRIHGGTITITSVLDQGTRVKIKLPKKG